MLAALTAYLLVLAARTTLVGLNLRHLERAGGRVPPGFEGVIDAAALAKAARYTRDRARVGLLQSGLEGVLGALFFFGGWLGAYDRWIGSLTLPPVADGVLFFLLLHWAQTLVEIPFRLYATFRVESRHGFNTTTPGLWCADLLKAEVLGSFLLGGVAAVGLALVRRDPDHWWVWVWLFAACLALFLLYASPVLIEPLFFRFRPVEKEGLEAEIRVLLGRAGLRVSRVLQVDASRRSRHSNAYFAGIGRTRRIVLFDTLLDRMDRGEILAVLAHEAGHWVKGHIPRRLAASLGFGLGALYLAHILLPWPGLPAVAGLGQASLPARLTLLALLGSLAAFPLTPLLSARSRRHEAEADRYATRLTGAPAALASALTKLSRENLANLHPHPLYAWFYASHPPVVERVARLRSTAGP